MPKFSNIKSTAWTTAMFLVGLLSPWFALFVISFNGVTELSQLNGKFIFLLATVTIVVMVIRTLLAFISKEKKGALLNAALTTICLISYLAAIKNFLSM